MRYSLLMMLVSCVISVAAIEIYLRIDDSSSNQGHYNTIKMNGTPYQIMEQLERFSELDNAIIVIGDSFVAGSKCAWDRNLTGHLSRYLPEFTVVNLGTGGTGIFSYANKFSDYLAEFGPPSGAIVVLYSNDIRFYPMLCYFKEGLITEGNLSVNDVNLISEYCEGFIGKLPAMTDKKQILMKAREPRAGGLIDDFLYDVSLAYRLLRLGVIKLMSAVSEDQGPQPTTYPAGWSTFEDLRFKTAEFGLSRLRDMAREHDVDMMIVFYPNVEMLTKDSPLYNSYESAKDRLRTILKTPVFSGYDAFLGNPRASSGMSWSLIDYHPVCEAHNLMAQWMAGLYMTSFAEPVADR